MLFYRTESGNVAAVNPAAVFPLGFVVLVRMALETVPRDLRDLRACLLRSLVTRIDQFDGCDNCDA